MSDLDYSKLAIVKYARKPFHIDAIQVTAENLEDVSTWASGELRTDSDTAGKKYIKVRVHRPLNERQTKAYVGDWVLYAGTGFKVYTTKAFAASFEPVEGESTNVEGDVVDAKIALEATATPAPKAKKTA